MTGKTLIKRFWRDEAGATAIEYGLIAAMIAVAAIASFTLLGNAVIDLFGHGAGGASEKIAEQVEILSSR